MKRMILTALTAVALAACSGEGAETDIGTNVADAPTSANQTDFSPLSQAARSLSPTEAQMALLTLPDGASEDVKNGEALFKAKCATCHGFGIEQGATQRLERRYDDGLSYALAVRTDLSPEFITTFVRQNSPGMPAFRKAELSDEDLADLIEYLTRNSDLE